MFHQNVNQTSSSFRRCIYIFLTLGIVGHTLIYTCPIVEPSVRRYQCAAISTLVSCHSHALLLHYASRTPLPRQIHAILTSFSSCHPSRSHTPSSLWSYLVVSKKEEIPELLRVIFAQLSALHSVSGHSNMISSWRPCISARS